MRLIVTRPEPEATALAKELSALGHQPIMQPLLEFHPLPFDVTAVLKTGALIVTSGNALRALRDVMNKEQIGEIPVLCVGEETANRAREFGFKNVSSACGTAAELAQHVIEARSREVPLLHLAAEDRAFDLEGRLTLEGFSVRTLSAYRMKARETFDSWLIEMMEANKVDGAIFMSPRTAATYVSLCRQHRLLECAKHLSYYCLSANVAKELTTLDASDLRISAKPDRTTLLQLL